MRLRNLQKRIEAVMEARIPRKEGGRLLPWRILASRKEKGCFEFVFRVPLGYSHLEARRQIDAFYAACGAPIELKDYAGAVLIRVIPEDFPDSIPYDGKLLEAAPGKKEIVLGLSRQMEPLVHSLRVPHMLIAGKSGYGKTDLIRWILFQLIAKNSPDEIEIWIIDLKGFSFLPFKGIPQVKRIVRDLPSAAGLLQEATRIMEARSRAVWDSGDRSKAEGFKTIFVLIDEAYMIAPKVVTSKAEKALAKICDEAAAKISGTGREAGVGLLYCTQRPDAEVINPLVKANMDCKVCFKTETESNSIIVLDMPGAEGLPQGRPGRILYSRDGLEEALVPYIGKDAAWEELLEPYRREQDEPKRDGFDIGPGDSDFFNGASGPEFLEEWIPFQEGKRVIDKIGGGGVIGGQTAGDWKE